MEEITKIEELARHNLNIANHEKILVLESKKIAKIELERSKARENLAKKDLELAKSKERLLEKTRKYIKDKQDVKEILNLSESGLKIEFERAMYVEKVAEVQIEIAEIHLKISKFEKEISDKKFKLVEEKEKMAKERENLSKIQYKYINMKRKDAPEGKTSNIKEDINRQELTLKNARKKGIDTINDIEKVEWQLSDMKKRLAEKLLKREQLRPPISN